MNEGRIVFAEFCDDIRLEVGNKYSLMGCYTGELIMQPIPSLLPKLCAAITAVTPIEKPFQSLIFRAFLNDDLIVETEIQLENLQKNHELLTKDPKDFTKLLVRVQMAFVPLVVQQESVLRIEAETEEGIIKGSKLLIRGLIDTDQQVTQ